MEKGTFTMYIYADRIYGEGWRGQIRAKQPMAQMFAIILIILTYVPTWLVVKDRYRKGKR